MRLYSSLQVWARYPFCSEVMLFQVLTWQQYVDPVLDSLDVHQIISHRLIWESCYNHKGNYVKVSSVLVSWLSYV